MSVPHVAAHLVLATVIPGCIAGDDVTVMAKAFEPVPCAEIICGNGPAVGIYRFAELDWTKQQFSPIGGVRISSVKTFNGVSVTPVVDGFALYGRVGNTDYSLIGGSLRLDTYDGQRFEVKIAAGPALPYFEGGDDGTLVPTYRFTYRALDPSNLAKGDVCGVDDPDTLVPPREAVVFAGDRIDFITGRVIATGDAADPWFTIGCRDDATWKLAMMRHVEAAQAPGYETSQGDRSAALQAIRAAYCGDGHPYTFLGNDNIDWRNRGDWMWIDTPDFLPEAIWGPDGALCLDYQRDPSQVVDCAAELPACDELGHGLPELGNFETWTSPGV